MNTEQRTEDRFEARLRRIVSDGTDRRLAPPRSAPPFDPGVDEPARPPQRRWLVALVAAACALILAAGALVATNVLRPTPMVPADPAPRPTLTQLGGAGIALPQGWVSIPTEYMLDDSDAWCLSTRNRPTVAAGDDDCPMWLVSVHDTSGLVPDLWGGFGHNGVPCNGVDDSTEVDRLVEPRTFGGRRAEWRRWNFRCESDGRRISYEQYVIAQQPAWILYTDHATDPAITSVMTSIARDSQIPG